MGIDMCTEMCVDMYIDLSIDMFLDQYTDICVDMYIASVQPCLVDMCQEGYTDKDASMGNLAHTCV